MQNNVFVHAKNLSRFYGVHCAVKQLNFDVKRGEVVGLLGPNGAGKSTTMLMLTGNLAPTEGEIVINGIDLLDQPKAAKQHIGFLPEQPPVYREFTVNEYLKFCAFINRIPRRDINAAVDTAKQRCGLTEVGKKLINNLSKGYQQRVGIAQAIIHSPPVVILDEPTVGLDPNQIREIRQLILELTGDHCIILSSHILPEVQTICDRVLIINKGELILDDSVKSLQQQLQSSCLLVALERPPGINELQRLENITSVDQLDDQHFRFHFTPGKHPAQFIAETAVNNKWGLYEITPEKRSLEQVFIELTTKGNEPAHNKPSNNQENIA